MLERLDFWLMVITLSFLAWLESRALRRKMSAFWGWFMAWNETRGVNRLRSVPLSSEGGRGGSPSLAGSSETGSRIPVPPHQNQAEPKMVLDFGVVLSFLSGHKFSDEELIKILSVLQRQSGDYLLSANKIRDSVGGADAVVKAQVAILRPKKEQPKPSHSLRRPVDGW